MSYRRSTIEAKKFLKSLYLEKHSDMKVGNLTGGMARKLQLAIALAGQPKVSHLYVFIRVFYFIHH